VVLDSRTATIAKAGNVRVGTWRPAKTAARIEAFLLSGRADEGNDFIKALQFSYKKPEQLGNR
jgi:hypothetical protein